jgi:hypothetical protein
MFYYLPEIGYKYLHTGTPSYGVNNAGGFVSES